MPVLTDLSFVLADNLRREMQVRNLTQTELADRLGVSYPRISEILAGGNPRLSTVAKLAEALDLAPAVLLTYREPAEKSFAKS